MRLEGGDVGATAPVEDAHEDNALPLRVCYTN